MNLADPCSRRPGLPAWTSHPLWRAGALTGLGVCAGLLSLLLGASAYPKLPFAAIFPAYFTNPLLLFLNLLPPVLLVWGFTLLFRRAWAGFFLGYLPVLAVSLANYFKIRLRSDPLVASDLGLTAEAGNIVKRYTLEFTPIVLTAVLFLPFGLAFAKLLVPDGTCDWRDRCFAGASCLALLAVAAVSLYSRTQIYERAVPGIAFDSWSDTDNYVARGCVYPFLHSIQPPPSTPVFEMIPSLDEMDKTGEEEPEAPLVDVDIPEERKVSVMGIMIEAFCDMTDFDILASQESVQEVYRPWRELEAQSVSGRLLTNIFAGGTIDTEREFLTGLTGSIEFESYVDSYVWYLRKQGYQTFGSHLGDGWFYDRNAVSEYMGFEEYWFSENHYDQLIDPKIVSWTTAPSDKVLVEELAAQLKERIQDGPCFSFSVTIQNHGPYISDYNEREVYLTPEGTGLAPDSCHILNNYLHGIGQTMQNMVWLSERLEEMEEPVVLVLFGDHKPWAGQGNSVYLEMGADFVLSTNKGLYDKYATPYLIWANSAAKEVLGEDFTGSAGDFSPCFLMNQVFDLCGWQGPAYMELARRAQAATPLIHTLGLYWQDGAVTDQLSLQAIEPVWNFLTVQKERREKFDPEVYLGSD